MNTAGPSFIPHAQRPTTMCFPLFFSVYVGDWRAITSNLTAIATLRILYLYYSQMTISFTSVQSELPRASLYDARINIRVVSDLRTTCWDPRFYKNLSYCSRNMIKDWPWRLHSRVLWVCPPPLADAGRQDTHSASVWQGACSVILLRFILLQWQFMVRSELVCVIQWALRLFFSCGIFKIIIRAVGIGYG